MDQDMQNKTPNRIQVEARFVQMSNNRGVENSVSPQ